MKNNRFDSKIFLSTTIDVSEASLSENPSVLYGSEGSKDIGLRILRSTGFIIAQAFKNYVDKNTLIEVDDISICFDKSGTEAVNVSAKISIDSIEVPNRMHKILLDLVFKDFVGYIDGMGLTITNSSLISPLWYSESIQKNDSCKSLCDPDNTYEYFDVHSDIDYVLYRDSMSMTLSDYESVVEEFYSEDNYFRKSIL